MPTKHNKKLSIHFYNKITYTGLVLISVVLINEFVVFAMDMFSGNPNLYVGLFTYLVLPPFLFLGVALIFIGFYKKRRQYRLGIETEVAGKKALIIDFSKQHNRNLAMAIIAGLIVLGTTTTVLTYKAYQYTESVRFCGQVCHNVMKPEFTTYGISPHSRVKCVECHIGGGVGSYVHSKLAGARQVFKLARGIYPRPVPIPVHNLRPAKETCEECHWPGKIFGNVELERNYFSNNDEGQTRHWRIRMLMHVSGHGKKNTGIHAHMYLNNKVSYVANDDKRQMISWIRVLSNEGKETIYTTDNSPYKDTPPPANKIRSMDCIDCHSRPAHNFEAPMPLVNQAITDGRINMDIPFIKTKAVEALAKKTYTTQEQAVTEIRDSLLKFYKDEQADYYAAHQNDVDSSILALTEIYKKSFFPEMKSRWDEYPNNIGHMISPGCFRCHDGEHTSKDGQKISHDCEGCHTIIGQGPTDKMQENINGLTFRHPFDEDESWKDMSCVDCHTGS